MLQVRAALIRTVDPALAAIRSGAGSLAVVIVLGALAMGVTTSVRSLAADGPAGTTLSVPSAPPPTAAVHWTPDVLGPSAVQTEALRSLFQLLEVLAWVAFAVAAVSLLSTFTIRAAIRGPEIRVHRSVGAARRDLLGALLVESGVAIALVAAGGLALAAAALAAAVSTWTGPASFRLAPGLALGLTAVLIVLGGLLPLGAARSRDVGYDTPGQVRLRFAALQLGLAMAILMAGTLLTDRRAPGPGEAAATGRRDLVFQIDSGTGDPAARSARFGALLTRLSDSRRFDSVSLAAPGELDGLGTVDAMSTDCGQCPSAGVILRWHHLQAGHHFVSPDTFAAEGYRIERGRAFTRDDGWGAERVAIVNRFLAARHFERGEAIGRPLYLSDGFLIRPYRVVGVVDDRRSPGLGGARQPLEAVYLSVLQHPPARVELTVRPRGADPVGDAVGAAVVETLGASATVGAPVPAADLRRMAAAPLDWFGRGYAMVGVLALVVGAIGAFASLRLWVGSIAGELAIRRSVGASRWRIAGYVLARGLGTAVGGVALGLFLFLSVLWGAVSDSVVGVAGWRWSLVGRLGGLLIAAGLAGAALPLRRVLRDPPAHALP